MYPPSHANLSVSPAAVFAGLIQLPRATNSNCPGPVTLKDDGIGAPAGAHSDTKSIVVTHIMGDIDFITGRLRRDMEITGARLGEAALTILLPSGGVAGFASITRREAGPL